MLERILPYVAKIEEIPKWTCEETKTFGYYSLEIPDEEVERDVHKMLDVTRECFDDVVVEHNQLEDFLFFSVALFNFYFQWGFHLRHPIKLHGYMMDFDAYQLFLPDATTLDVTSGEQEAYERENNSEETKDSSEFFLPQGEMSEEEYQERKQAFTDFLNEDGWVDFTSYSASYPLLMDNLTAFLEPLRHFSGMTDPVFFMVLYIQQMIYAQNDLTQEMFLRENVPEELHEQWRSLYQTHSRVIAYLNVFFSIQPSSSDKAFCSDHNQWFQKESERTGWNPKELFFLVMGQHIYTFIGEKEEQGEDRLEENLHENAKYFREGFHYQGKKLQSFPYFSFEDVMNDRMMEYQGFTDRLEESMWNGQWGDEEQDERELLSQMDQRITNVHPALYASTFLSGGELCCNYTHLRQKFLKLPLACSFSEQMFTSLVELAITNIKLKEKAKELEEKNRILQQQQEEKCRLLRQHAHNWKHFIYPKSIEQVCIQLIQDGSDDNMAYGRQLLNTYRSSINLMESLQLFLHEYLDDPVSLRESFQKSIVYSDHHEHYPLEYVVNDSLQQVIVALLFNQYTSETKVEQEEGSLFHPDRLEELSDRYNEYFIRGNQDGALMDWFSKEIYPISIKVSPEWENVGFIYPQTAYIHFQQTLYNLLLNAINYGVKTSVGSLELVFSVKKEEYLLTITNPIHRESAYLTSVGDGLASVARSLVAFFPEPTTEEKRLKVSESKGKGKGKGGQAQFQVKLGWHRSLFEEKIQETPQEEGENT